MVAGNEAVVGEVLQQFCADTGVGREEVVLVTKNSSSRGRAAAIANLERQLAELRVDYIDIYLLHSREPDPVRNPGSTTQLSLIAAEIAQVDWADSEW